MHGEGDHNFWWPWIKIQGCECGVRAHESGHSDHVGVVGVLRNLALRASSCFCDALGGKRHRRTSYHDGAFCSQERDELGR